MDKVFCWTLNWSTSASAAHAGENKYQVYFVVAGCAAAYLADNTV